MHRTNVGFNNHFVALREIPGIFRNDLYGSEDEKRRETKAPLGASINYGGGGHPNVNNSS